MQLKPLQQFHLGALSSTPPGRNVDPVETSDGGTFHGVVALVSLLDPWWKLPGLPWGQLAHGTS